jgi:hypothetical protein
VDDLHLTDDQMLRIALKWVECRVSLERLLEERSACTQQLMQLQNEPSTSNTMDSFVEVRSLVRSLV